MVSSVRLDFLENVVPRAEELMVELLVELDVPLSDQLNIVM